MPNFDQPTPNKDVPAPGQKPPSVADESHAKSESLIHRIQDEITNNVPIAAAAAAGFLVGLSARLPGSAGRAGKVAATIFGTAAAADAVVHGVEGHRDTNSKAYELDATFLASLGGGLLIPNLARSENAIGESKKIVQDVTGSINANSERALFGTERTALGIESLGVRSAADLPLTPRPSNVIDFGKYAEIYRKGASKMITEEQIGKFPPEAQAQIRKSIKEMTVNGYEPEYLMLAKNGEVMLDHDAAESGELTKALRAIKKEP